MFLVHMNLLFCFLFAHFLGTGGFWGPLIARWMARSFFHFKRGHSRA
jgi:hypothetical protein